MLLSSSQSHTPHNNIALSLSSSSSRYSFYSYRRSPLNTSSIRLSTVTRFQGPFTAEPLESKSLPSTPNPKEGTLLTNDGEILTNQGNDDEDDEISGVHVPRQKYIPVSKAELLDAIIATLFDSQGDDDARQFILLSACLDSILHVEHKRILEEMRNDYTLTHSAGKELEDDEVSAGSDRIVSINGNKADQTRDPLGEPGSVKRYEIDKGIEPGESMSFHYGLELRNFFGSLAKNVKTYPTDKSRVAVATRFQHAFMQLLYDAQFEELSARDLMLTSALNTDYLLTLPIYVDWKKASESNAIIFRRGYVTERQKGLLIVEKLDFIQSKVLQGIFFIISKPLGKIGSSINEALRNYIQTKKIEDLTKRIKVWFMELSLLQQSYNEEASDKNLRVNQETDVELPIWLAAQRAVSRYEGFLSSIGPRVRLFRKLLTWTGLISPTPEIPSELETDNNSSEPYLRPIFLSRISLSDIWRPATRKYCRNDLWKMIKTSVSILFSQTTLQEPAFEELILLYTKEVGERTNEEKAEVPLLQLKIYERIPLPDLPVIFPHKKLSFRIIDTVRLDIASILGLSAYFINYKFEDIVSSPSAIFLDAIAISALIIYVTRVALGYKQTWDRYQLLVNKTLYEKTLASGFGSVHFLLDASEQQQYKEAILAYAVLLNAKKDQVISHKYVGDECERFMFKKLKKKVKMPVEKAVNTLVRLGIAIEIPIDGRIILQAIPCSEAHAALKKRWNSLLTNEV